MQLLRRGSRGDDVIVLQRVLNSAGKSRFSNLADDGMFGPKTSQRVYEFQTANQLSADGIVGDKTWSQLDLIVKIIDHLVNQIPPEKEQAMRQRIADFAMHYQLKLGWRASDRVGSPASSFRIAANHAADGWKFDPHAHPPQQTSRNDLRLRQGGLALATIFKFAWPNRASRNSPLNISTRAVKNYALGIGSRNDFDIESWCGVFAMYVYRTAGIDVKWNAHANKFKGVIGRPPQKGDLGVSGFGSADTGGRNHHFIVINVAGGIAQTIEGNMVKKIGGEKYQTIIRHQRSISAIQSNPKSGFYSPKW